MSGVSTGSTPRSRMRRRRPANEVVGDVVKNLVLEALLDDPCRRLARPETGDARAGASNRARRGRSRLSTTSLGISIFRFLRVSLTSRVLLS
jgi:hypothetical protein